MQRSLFPLLILGFIVLGLSACNTHKRVQQQRLALLNAEINYLSNLNSTLTATPNPELNSSLSLFLSSSTLNSILSAADNYVHPIPGVSNAVLRVRNIRTQFDNGLPELAIDAQAERGNIKFRMRITAQLEPQLTNDRLRFIVHVRDATPEAQWRWYQIPTFFFVHSLLSVTVADWAQTLPELSVPVARTFEFATRTGSNPIDISTPANGVIHGAISIPSFSGRKTAAITNAIFLKDGVHLYCSLTR